LIIAAGNEVEKSVRNRIADTMGEIAGTIMRCKETWPEIIQFAVASAAGENPA
jgi:hypothetical protein